MTITTEDAIKAAASIARDVADGRLTPADLEHQAVAELHQLVGEVVGHGDPVWPLQVQIARGVLAAGGIPGDELSEWLAVARQRAGEAHGQGDPDQIAPEPVSVPSVALSPESDGDLADVDAAPEQPVTAAAVAEQPLVAYPASAPPRRADGYDPLAGWAAAKSGFVG